MGTSKPFNLPIPIPSLVPGPIPISKTNLYSQLTTVKAVCKLLNGQQVLRQVHQ